MSPSIPLIQDLGDERNIRETPLASLKSRSTAAMKGALQSPWGRTRRQDGGEGASSRRRPQLTCGQVLVGLLARLPLRVEGAAAAVAVAAAPSTSTAPAAAAVTAAALRGPGGTEELGSPIAQQHHLFQLRVVVHGGRMRKGAKRVGDLQRGHQLHLGLGCRHPGLAGWRAGVGAGGRSPGQELRGTPLGGLARSHAGRGAHCGERRWGLPARPRRRPV